MFIKTAMKLDFNRNLLGRHKGWPTKLKHRPSTIGLITCLLTYIHNINSELKPSDNNIVKILLNDVHTETKPCTYLVTITEQIHRYFYIRSQNLYMYHIIIRDTSISINKSDDPQRDCHEGLLMTQVHKDVSDDPKRDLTHEGTPIIWCLGCHE